MNLAASLTISLTTNAPDDNPATQSHWIVS